MWVCVRAFVRTSFRYVLLDSAVSSGKIGYVDRKRESNPFHANNKTGAHRLCASSLVFWENQKMSNPRRSFLFCSPATYPQTVNRNRNSNEYSNRRNISLAVHRPIRALRHRTSSTITFARSIRGRFIEITIGCLYSEPLFFE
jgi:hypothetical protein